MGVPVRSLLVRCGDYAVAIGLVALALAARAALDPWLGERLAVSALFGAIALGVWYAGVRAALVAAVLGFLAAEWLFVAPRGSLAAPALANVVGAAVYAFSAGAIVWVGWRLRRATRALEAAREREAGEQAERRASNERFRHAVRAGRMIAWEADLATGAVRASDNVREILGCEWRTIEDTWNCVHPDDRAAARERSRLARERGEPLAYEVRAIRPDTRETVWLEVRTDAAPGHDAPVRHVYGVSVDVTARKRAQLAYESEVARFRQLADAIPALVSVSSASGETRYVNRTALEYTGCSTEQLRTGGWLELVHPEDRRRVRDQLRRALQRGSVLESRYRLRRHDGEYRWLLFRGVPVVHADGHVERYGVGFDVDDTKRMELALQEADRRKDEFIATLAHELRNPLAPVRYAARLVRPDTPRAVLEQAGQMIERQAGQMARLLDDLLDVSRITRNVVELRRERVDLVHIVQQAIEASRPALGTLKHRLTVSLPSAPLFVDGDPIRLHQIACNLLDNAIKYTDPGGHVEVAAHEQDGRVRLVVRDSGMGIAPEMLERVFELFVQGHGGTGGRGGLGIGLSVVRRLVELHGGTIRAHSEGTGHGAEFVVELPPAAAADAEAPDSNVLPLFEGLPRVLVVDDNVDAAESLALMLRTQGWPVHVAHDGATAIEVCESLRPDVVVLDLGMPRVPGDEVARWIRRQPWGRDVRLIAATGWGQEQDRQRTREAGFDAHLVKPVDPDEIVRIVGEVERREDRAARG